MSERFAAGKWLAGSIGLASDESSDSWVAFTMNRSLEMGNVSATSNSQLSVSKRTPGIHNFTQKILSCECRNTNTCPFILCLNICTFSVCIENLSFVNS